jgi:formylglycine-generating enzyme required for sulfatase activity
VLAGLLAWGAVETYGSLRAAGLVRSLQSASIAEVPGIVEELAEYRRWAGGSLRAGLRAAPKRSDLELHFSLALVPVDPGQVDLVCERLFTAPAQAVPVLTRALEPHRQTLVPRLWQALRDAGPKSQTVLPAAAALAEYDPQGDGWTAVSGKVADALVSVNPADLNSWVQLLKPAGTMLSEALGKVFGDPSRPPLERELATSALLAYVGDQPGPLAGLLMDAEPRAYAALFPAAAKLGEPVARLLRDRVRESPKSVGDKTTEQDLDRLAEQQARAAIALVRIGQADQVWPLLVHSADPRLRSFIVNWLKPLGAEAMVIADEFVRRGSRDPAETAELVRRGSPDPAETADRRSPATDVRRPTVAAVSRSGDLDTTTAEVSGGGQPVVAKRQQVIDSVLFHPKTSIRRALILALGDYGPGSFPSQEQAELTRNLLDVYEHDPDAGIHGAARWALTQWGQAAKLTDIDERLTHSKDRNLGSRRWFVNGQGQTMVIIPGPVEFLMGSPNNEAEREGPVEERHRRVIPRSFAIADREVSLRQFLKYNADHDQNLKYGPDEDGPVNRVSWYQAAAYCNWLSEQEGMPDDLCYIPRDKADYEKGVTIPADVLKRKGYRLPTEAEWECACRAGAGTSRYYGHSVSLLDLYARYVGNSREHAWVRGSLMPNDLGLFDMLGNQFEWCQEQATCYRPGESGVITDGNGQQTSVDASTPRLLRGGAFSTPPAVVRSADRDRGRPLFRSTVYGFRPARTYH